MELTKDKPLTLDASSSPDPVVVSSLQLRAISLMLQGHSARRIARTLSISRATLHRWSNYHAGFMAELGRQRQELHDNARQRLSALLTRSLNVVAKDLSSKDRAHRLSAARLIIAHCAPRTTAPDPKEPTRPDDIIDPVAEYLRGQSPCPAPDGAPLTEEDREEARLYLSQSLAAPHLQDDPA